MQHETPPPRVPHRGDPSPAGKHAIIVDEMCDMLSAVVKLCSDGVRSMGDNVLLQNLLVRSKFLTQEVRFFRQVMAPLYELLKRNMTTLEMEANRESENDSAPGVVGRGRNAKGSSASNDAFMAFMEDLIDCLFNTQAADGSSDNGQAQMQSVTSEASVQRFNRLVRLSSSVYVKLGYLSKCAFTITGTDNGNDKTGVKAVTLLEEDGIQSLSCSSQNEFFSTQSIDSSFVEDGGLDVDPFQDDDLSMFLVADAGTGIVDSNFQQERNAYAIKALRRVNAKLEGLMKTSSSSHPRKASFSSTTRASPSTTNAVPVLPLTVEQQTDWLIREATSKENLARMYEGWTPWL